MPKSFSLEKLNRLARQKVTCLDRMKSFDLKAPTNLFRAPESLGSIQHMPSFDLLSERQKVRLNQLYACSVLELFIWFEQLLICPLLLNLSKSTKNPEMQEAISHFVEDEGEHSEMFWRVLQAREPELYHERRRQFGKLGMTERILFGLMVRFPTVFLVWVWLAIFFEERTQDISLRYMAAESAGEKIDDAFTLVHRLHLADEARHFQMDLHFLEHFYDQKPASLRSFAGFVFGLVMKPFVSPRRSSLRALEILAKEDPGFSKHLQQKLRSELNDPSNFEAYRQKMFSPDSTPRSFEIFRQYQECRSALAVLKLI